MTLGSGNIVHNLRDAIQRRAAGSNDTPDWAQRFDSQVAEAPRQRDTAHLLRCWPNSDNGRLAHPIPDHWLPLIYAYAATEDSEQASFPIEGFDLGSISMRSVSFGA